MSAHFWTEEPCADVDEWEPDAAPERYASGWGHAFLEPYVRLKANGSRVTIGSDAPQETTVMFAILEELGQWAPRLQAERVLRLGLAALRHPRVVIVRNDYPLEIPAPGYAALELLPSEASALVRPGRVVRPLPQRGLVPRDPSRGTTVDVAVIKAFPSNVPEWIPGLERQLARIGVDLRVDTTPERWPDFLDCDVVICARRTHAVDSDPTFARKPPTKLVNAWLAGAVPLCAPEESYLAAARPGVDALIADGPDAMLTAIQSLRSDRTRMGEILTAGLTRHQEYDIAAVLSQWTELLRFDAPLSRSTVAASLASPMARALQHRTRRLYRRGVESFRIGT